MSIFCSALLCALLLCNGLVVISLQRELSGARYDAEAQARDCARSLAVCRAQCGPVGGNEVPAGEAAGWAPPLPGSARATATPLPAAVRDAAQRIPDPTPMPMPLPTSH